MGIHSSELAALYLPRAFADLRQPGVHWPDPEALAADKPPAGFGIFKITRGPKTIDRGGPPRTTMGLVDASGLEGEGVIWGNDRKTIERLRKAGVGRKVLLEGRFGAFRGTPQIAIKQWVSPKWVGRIMPVYTGKKGVMGAETLRDRLVGLLSESVPAAAAWIEQRLADATPAQRATVDPDRRFADVEAMLWQAHLPNTRMAGEAAIAALDRINALDRVVAALAERHERAGAPIAIADEALAARTGAFGFELTDEQRQAVAEIIDDLRKPVGMHRLLTGDVGTGKTAVYASTAAAAADAGARVAVLAPSVTLAAQIHNEMSTTYPDLDIRRVSAGGKTAAEDAQNAAVVVSTTALLHQPTGRFDFVVVDEQHKFSRDQREQLSDTHLLEVSATCIPRTQALLQVGVTQLSRLRGGHADKTLHTAVRGADERRAVFERCRQTVNDGEQLAIIYPTREDGEQEAETIKSAESAAAAWERHFPGRVALVHGQMKDTEKREAVNAMREDRADVLVSTTVIEVGLNLPRLRHLLVVDAERYGLTTLHQLRGRLARHGGEGRMDLYLSRECPEPVMERLRCLEQTDDGFELADMDLALRGQGDLAGDQQSGQASGLLVNRPVGIDAITAMVAPEGETEADHMADTAADRVEPADDVPDRPESPPKRAAASTSFPAGPRPTTPATLKAPASEPSPRRRAPVQQSLFDMG